MNKLLRILGTLVLCLALLCGCQAESFSENGGPAELPQSHTSKKDRTVLFDSTIGEEDGYSYELWKDSGTTRMTLTGDGTFSCEWSNINNSLFRRGLKFDCTQTYREIGNITCDFAADYNPDGNSYLCIYGWTRDPLIEYYIVESWGSWRPPGGAPIATITVGGDAYDVYRTLRVNQPSIDGNTTFEQYWSVRQEKREEGSVNVSAHFAAWEGLGMTLGKMYESALTVEGYQSAGSATITKNEFTMGGEIPEELLPEPIPPEETDSEGRYFRSEFESGSDGWAPRGDCSVNPTDKAAYSGSKSLYVTGRRDSWNGAGRDLKNTTYIPGSAYSFGVAVMQDVAEAETFKLTLQYNTASGTNYAGIAEAEAEKGEWVVLENTGFTIPEGSWGLLLYVETSSGTNSFYIDEAYGATEGVAFAAEQNAPEAGE